MQLCWQKYTNFSKSYDRYIDLQWMELSQHPVQSRAILSPIRATNSLFIAGTGKAAPMGN